MMDDILPPGVAVHEVFGDLPDVVLFPAEEAAVAKAVDKRRREFATARACARAALATLGLPSVPIVPGVRGAPQWPSGVVGSITHCAGYRACAAAHERDVMTIGLDAEPHDKLPDGVLDAISFPAERARLAELTATVPAVCWDRLLFSAKESVYKAWFPLTGRWLGFEEAVVDFDPVRQTFTARLLVEGPMVNGIELTGFEGRWLVSSGLVAAAIVIVRALCAHHSHPGRRFALDALPAERRVGDHCQRDGPGSGSAVGVRQPARLCVAIAASRAPGTLKRRQPCRPAVTVSGCDHG